MKQVIAAATSIVSYGNDAFLPPSEFPPPIYGLIDLFGGEENFSLAVNSRQTVAHRLSPQGNSATVDDFVVTQTTPLEHDDAVALRSLLLSDASYTWDEISDCTPNYGFRISLAHQPRAIWVDLCFECRIARVMVDKQEIAAQGIRDSDVWELILARCFPDTFKSAASSNTPPQ